MPGDLCIAPGVILLFTLWWFFSHFSASFARIVRPYRHQLEVRDPIWGDEWSHSLHWQSINWDFSRGFPVLKIHLCIAPGFILLSPWPLDDKSDWRDIGASGLWLGTRTVFVGTATLAQFFFDATHAPWTTGKLWFMKPEGSMSR